MRALCTGLMLLATLPQLAGCASGPDETIRTAGSNQPEERTCLKTDRIQDFEVLDGFNVRVQLLGGEHYQLALRSDCERLEDAVTMTFRSSAPWMCPDNFSRIYFRNWAGRADDCRVIGVEELIMEAVEPDVAGQD